MTTISNDISQIEQTPINFPQIQSIVHPSVKRQLVMRELDKLPKNCTTKDVFGGKKYVALFCDRHMHGRIVASHWICLLNKGKHIEMFDSLGNTPLSLTHKLQSPSHGFLDWCKKNKIRSSTAKLQQNIMQDCGDWVAIRLTKARLSNKQFVKWVKSFHIAPDKVVSLMVLPSILPDTPVSQGRS